MEILMNGKPFVNIRPMFANKPVVIGIDSSKTNTAIMVSDPRFNPIADFEIRGGGNANDVFDVAAITMKFVATVFEGARIILAGIENPITKRDKEGMSQHSSRLKITVIWTTYNLAFRHHFNTVLVQVNNWTWKQLLPAEYRTRDRKKGSLDYMQDMGTIYAGRKDDVTDVYFITKYLCSTISNYKATMFNREDAYPLIENLDIEIYSTEKGNELVNDSNSVLVDFNSEFSLEENLSYHLKSQTDRSKYVLASIPIEKFDLSWLKFVKEKIPRGSDTILIKGGIG